MEEPGAKSGGLGRQSDMRWSHLELFLCLEVVIEDLTKILTLSWKMCKDEYKIGMNAIKKITRLFLRMDGFSLLLQVDLHSWCLFVKRIV